jgi:prepilin-type N-terminal cleavage/methylation domain-containing protein
MEPTSVLARAAQAIRAREMRGFTLVEIMVVLALIAILTTIAVTGQSTFNRSQILNDTAYGVAFSARQAQTYGISSRGYTGNTNVGYGLHFDAATLNQYVFFADSDQSLLSQTLDVNGNPFCPIGEAGKPSSKKGDCVYNAAQAEAINTYTFTRGITLQKVCAKKGLNSNCTNSSTANKLNNLDIVFTRPNTTTTISGQVGAATARTQFDCVDFTLVEPSSGTTKTFRISNLGEIAMNVTCP